MSENEDTSSSSERVKGDEYVLKKANLKEEEEKGTTVKVDTKEDATSEEWDILQIDKIKNIE